MNNPLLLLIAVTTFLSGCAGILSPHVYPKRELARDPTIDAGFAYADNVIDLYNKAMGRNATVETVTGTSFLLLSAGAIGNSVTGGTENTSTWLGIVGGSAYGFGAFVSNKPRRLVYAAGIGAMSCVKQVMIPYKISPGEEKNLDYAIKKLSESVPRMSGSAGVESRIADGYAETLESGLRLQSQLAQSGTLMIATVDRVVGQVNAALVSTNADLSAVKEILDGIAASHTKVEVPEAQSEPADQKFANVLSKVDETVFATAEEGDGLCKSSSDCARTIQRIVAQFNAALPKEALAACGVDGSIVNALEVQPDAKITVDHGTKQTVTRLIEGGSGRYLARALVDTEKAPEITQTSMLGSEVRIEVAADSPAATYQFVILDAASEAKVFITLDVVKKSD